MVITQAKVNFLSMVLGLSLLSKAFYLYGVTGKYRVYFLGWISDTSGILAFMYEGDILW